MRGEHSVTRDFMSDHIGSSPHARGTHVLHRVAPSPEGIIPACAGNTDSRHELAQALDGSSPHARGTLHAGREGIDGRGIIPACAGNTRSRPASQPRWRDHPRMRGEHPSTISSQQSTIGSSPHARGTPMVESGISWRQGIIPACAGNTCQRWRILSLRWDHPRMRGEHEYSIARTSRARGSSPHARGTREADVRLPRRDGIIPACAGNTVIYLQPIR